MFKVSVMNASGFAVEEVKYFKTKAEAQIYRNVVWTVKHQFTKLEDVTESRKAKRQKWCFCVKGMNGVTLAFEKIGDAERFFGMGTNTLRNAFNMTKKRMYKGAKVYFDYAVPTLLSTVSDDVKNSMFIQTGKKRKVKVTDSNGNEMIFKSVIEAAKKMHVAKASIYAQAGKKENYKGYYYEFVEG